MNKQNTRNLQKFVVCHEISDEESKDIEMMIKSFFLNIWLQLIQSMFTTKHTWEHL